MALQKVYDAHGQTYYVEVEPQTPDSNGRVALRQVFKIGESVAPDPPSGIVAGAKTVTTAGTAEQLVASETACKKIIMTAEDDNTGKIYYGGSSVSSSLGDYLFAAQKIEIEIDDVSKVYIDSDQDGDGVKFSYFT